MQRISSILDKLQSIQNRKEPKSVIDIDLMLDYTRVLYADLLEWKSNIHIPAIPDEPTLEELAQSMEKEADTEASIPVVQESFPEPLAVPETAPAATVQPVEIPPAPPLSVPADQLPYTEPESPREKEESIGERLKKMLFPDDNEDDTMNLEPILKKKNPLYTDKETTAANPVPELFPAEEETYTDERETEDIFTPAITAVKQEPPLPPPAQPVLAAPAPEEPKPIPLSETTIPSGRPAPIPNYGRNLEKQIGINDKYQFISELFHGNKEAYEETIRKINSMGSYQAAQQWLMDEIEVRFNWNDENYTVQEFYHTVTAFFNPENK